METLDARVSKQDKAHKGALTRHVNALAARLDEQVATTRALIRSELKTALSKGGIDLLGDALASATARMDAAEVSQNEAITRINRHLADMARAVDARLAQEARDRVRDIRGVEERLSEAKRSVEARIDTVERDSADALTRVGDQVSRIHDKLEDARRDDTDTVTEKVNELALQTQAELERHHATLDARLEKIEARHDAIDPDALSGVAARAADRLREQLSAQMAQLQARIEGLEAEAATLAYNAAQAQQASQAATPAPAPTAAPVLSAVPDNPYAPALMTSPTASNDAASKAGGMLNAQPSRASHVPAEFDPKAYAAQSAPSVVPFAPIGGVGGNPLTHNPAPHTSGAPLSPAPAAAHTNRMPAPAPAPTLMPAAATPPPMPVTPGSLLSQTRQDDRHAEPDFQPAPLPDAPYANPAYAEGDSPVAVRIGENEGRKSRKRRAPKSDGEGFSLPISGRNLKLGALMVGVSLAAVLTARTLLGGNPAPNPQAGLQPMLDVPPAAAPAGQNAAIVAPSATIAPQSTAPIGQYAEAAPVRIDAGEMNTLGEAVAAGDPAALFQMALARIEKGQPAEGAKLLQQAADQDQPAALYRLAKLYEAGQGVEQSEARARQLIERAARGGNRIAMHDLALYYTEGRGGLDLDMLSARSWFEQAAMRGVLDSQYNLAVLSESAEPPLTPNVEDAMFWYTVAANQGDQYAVQRRTQLAPTFSADAMARVEARVAAFTPRPIDEEANGIFGAQAWTQSAKAAPAGPDETVRTAQSLLGQLGYEVGTADGLMGARTRAAIMRFEESNGLPATGRINAALINRLELAAGA